MSDIPAGLLTILTLVAILALVHVPLGDYIADTFTSDKDLRVERAIYRVCGVSPRSQRRWTTYAVSLIAFSVISFAALFGLCLLQPHLPLARGASMDVSTSFNTAIFVTNTNWQSYGGESGASPVLQTLGLTIQNFASASVGLAVVVALIRGLSRTEPGTIGNFWVDLVRGIVRILLPLAFIDPHLTCRVDPGLTERVLANLIENAVRHTPPGTPVCVSAEITGGHVEVRVIDRGPGVPADQRAAIFEPFQRYGDAPRGSGVGLGLAVAKGPPRRWAGLSADDTPGGGLTMTVRLP